MTLDLSNPEGLKAVVKRALKFIEPPEDLLPSEFAERYLRISAGNAIPGPVRFRNAPHQVEPLNLIDDPTCERITLMWGAQTGKTQAALMAKAYFIAHKPSNIMAMQPSQPDLSTWLNAKFNPMVEASEILSARIAKARGREGTNNQNMVTYPGGAMMFAWSGSPKTMRGRSAPKIFPDETDGYDRTKEGHQVGLIWQRAATFRDERLLFETSTPTLAETSYIEPAFNEGDQRRYHVPCFDCNEVQYLKWSQVTWQQDDEGEHMPHTAAYACEHCGSLWDDSQRYKALDNGKWIAAKPFKGHASFHFPEMGSKFVRLMDVVKSFLSKKAMGDLQTFTNVSLAETWKEKGLTSDPDLLYSRREHYPAEVPKGAVFITCTVDTQDDRFELQWEGWGDQQENWKLHYQTVRGNLNEREVWDRLDIALDKTFKHESGIVLNTHLIGQDTAGHFTQEVYNYIKRSRHSIYALKGATGRDANLVAPPTRNNLGNVNLHTLGVHKLKKQIYQRSGIQKPGAGYVHFPISDLFEIDYFKMYTAEELRARYIKGVNMEEWVKIRPRNEAFDLSVYNLGLVYIFQPDFKYYQQQLENKIFKPDAAKPKPKQRSGWVNNSNKSWI